MSLAVEYSHIGFRSMWRDEGITVAVVSGSWSGFLERWYKQDFVMGFYFAVEKAWVGMAGYTPRSLRTVSALSIVALVVICWLGAKRHWGRLAGALTVVYLLTSQSVVLSGRDARAYALVCLLGTCAYFTLLRTLGTGRRGWSFCVLAGLTAYAHPLAALAPFGMLVGVFFAAPRRTRPRVFRLALGFGVLLGPLVVAQMHARTGLYWVGRPTAEGVYRSVEWLLVGLGRRSAKLIRAAVLALGVAVAVIATIRRRSEDRDGSISPEAARSDRLAIGALLGWAVVPTAVLIAASYVSTPVFVDRYALASVPAVALLAAFGVSRLRSGVAILLGVLVLVAWSGPLTASLRWQSSEDWWGAFRATDLRRGAGDVVMAGGGRSVMSHYFSLQLYKPTEVFAVWPKATDTRPFARANEVDTVATIAALPVDRTVWLFTFEGQPSDPIGPLGAALGRARCVTYDERFADVRARAFPPASKCQSRS